jgi:hypothetical protein
VPPNTFTDKAVATIWDKPLWARQVRQWVQYFSVVALRMEKIHQSAIFLTVLVLVTTNINKKQN